MAWRAVWHILSGVRSKRRIALIALTGLVLSSRGQIRKGLTLSSAPTHLRSGNAPEWEEFAARTPVGRRLDLRFTAQANAAEATLFIRQEDVRQDWFVELNGKRLGKLFLMEADLVHAIAVPAHALKSGENVLSVIPPRDNDDIVLRDISIDPRPMREALREGALGLRVGDKEAGNELPCGLTFVSAQGPLGALVGLSNAPSLAVRPGVVYTGNGRAAIGLSAGGYTVFASRGFEWSVATQRVHIASGGSARLDFELSRVVPTPGWVSCDTHVHTLTHSGHGDASLEERMLTLAGEIGRASCR